MKKIIFSLILSLFTHIAYSQTYHVTYHSKYISFFDADDPKFAKLSAEMIKKIKDLMADLVEVYRLENKDSQSRFYFDYALVKGEIDRDSRRYINRRYVIKDFSKGEYFYEWFDQSDDEDSAERKALNTWWRIDAKRDTFIAGFECKRAMLKGDKDNENVIAWFTPSIPIMDGPFKYAGLPGLIVRLESKNSTIQVHDIQVIADKINKNTKTNIPLGE